VRFILISAFLVVQISACFGQLSLDKKIGVVNSLSDQSACLAIKNAGLKRGDTIQVVLPNRPQTALTTSIERRENKSCSSAIDIFENSSFYRLRISDAPPAFNGFGVVGAARIRTSRGVASADLNGDGKADHFRSCTATEGEHLTIWTGRPLVGKRIWHAYYYLGYDTIPTCKKNDTKGL